MNISLEKIWISLLNTETIPVPNEYGLNVAKNYIDGSPQVPCPREINISETPNHTVKYVN